MNMTAEMVQRMKAAALNAKHAGEAPIMHFDERISALKEFQLTACPANVVDLVEELEKEKGYASAYEAEKWHYHGSAESEGERANRAEARLEAALKRIAELETYSKTTLEFREAALNENRHLKLELEIADKRIAELESRTVKLPEVRITIAESKLRNLTYQQLDAFNAGASRAVAKLSQVLAAAGVAVEGN